MVGGGRRARGVKGGEGRDVSPVPPTMAMDIRSRNYQWSLEGEGGEIYHRRLLGGTWWGCWAIRWRKMERVSMWILPRKNGVMR